MPTVTMTAEEYDTLKKQSTDKDTMIADLNKKIVEARMGDPNASVAQLTQLVRSMLPIVQFAVANLSPTFTKGWPVQALLDTAGWLPALPDFSPFDAELGGELAKFANECASWADKRRTTPEKEVPPPFPVHKHPLVQLSMGQVPDSATKTTVVEVPNIDAIDREILAKSNEKPE